MAGVFQLYRTQEDAEADKCVCDVCIVDSTVYCRRVDYRVPDLQTFVTDMQHLCAMIADGPLKSFCYRRLSYLQVAPYICLYLT